MKNRISNLKIFFLLLVGLVSMVYLPSNVQAQEGVPFANVKTSGGVVAEGDLITIDIDSVLLQVIGGNFSFGINDELVDLSSFEITNNTTHPDKVTINGNRVTITGEDTYSTNQSMFSPSHYQITFKAKKRTQPFSGSVVIDADSTGNSYNTNNGPSDVLPIVYDLGTYTYDFTSLTVKDSTIPYGSDWQAADNFVDATDADRNPVNLSTVTVSGEVNTVVPGVYPVTYQNGSITKIAYVTVLPEDKTSINAKDSTINKGTEWNPIDNFVDGTDETGTPIDFSQVTVEGTVDTSKPGNYSITYSYNGKSITIVVTVVDDTTITPPLDGGNNPSDNGETPTTEDPVLPGISHPNGGVSQNTTITPPLDGGNNPSDNRETPTTEDPVLPGISHPNGGVLQNTTLPVKNNSGSIVNNGNSLPKTGEEKTRILLYVGLVAVALVGLLGYFKYKNSEIEEN